MPNLLVSPNAINVAPWSVSGTGASFASATTFNAGTAGNPSLMQTFNVTPGLVYECSVTVATASGTNGSVTLNFYKPDYSVFVGGSNATTLTASPQTISCAITIPAGFTQVIFELDYTGAANAVESVTSAAVLTPTGNLALLGCGG